MKHSYITENGVVTECVNVRSGHGGMLCTVDPQRNAVVIEVFRYFDEDDKERFRRFVWIECVSEELLPHLIEEAKGLLPK